MESGIYAFLRGVVSLDLSLERLGELNPLRYVSKSMGFKGWSAEYVYFYVYSAGLVAK